MQRGEVEYLGVRRKTGRLMPRSSSIRIKVNGIYLDIGGKLFSFRHVKFGLRVVFGNITHP